MYRAAPVTFSFPSFLVTLRPTAGMNKPLPSVKPYHGVPIRGVGVNFQGHVLSGEIFTKRPGFDVRVPLEGRGNLRKLVAWPNIRPGLADGLKNRKGLIFYDKLPGEG